MSEENTEKMNFFKRIVTSIKDFDKYAIFGVEKTRKALAYLAILLLIFSSVLAVIMTYTFSASINKGISYLKDNINEITYSQGKLSINSGEELEFKNEEEIVPIIIINTNANTEQEGEYLSKISNYSSGLIILNNRIIYKNQAISQNLEYKFNDIADKYNISEFNKDTVINFINNVNEISFYISLFIVVAIYMFAIYFVTTVVDAIVLGVLGFLFARIVGIRMKFKATFNMGVYALTLPIILNLIYIVVNAFTGFEIKYFQWMYTTISYIYMIVAILIIKADLITKQAELMKIIEEQERVKQEISKQEEQKKQDEEKNQNKENKDGNEEKEDKEENKQKKKNKKQDNNIGTNRTCSTRNK